MKVSAHLLYIRTVCGCCIPQSLVKISFSTFWQIFADLEANTNKNEEKGEIKAYSQTLEVLYKHFI